MRCPTCKKRDTYAPWEGKIMLMGVEVFTHGSRCGACGETLFDYDEVGRQEQIVVRALVARGIRAGNEFALVRKLAGLRAVDVAAMLDVTPDTVSRWERGKAPLPRMAAYVISDLYEHPDDARLRLQALAS